MPAANYLPEILETTEAERLATGFIFTDGPLWQCRSIAPTKRSATSFGRDSGGRGTVSGYETEFSAMTWPPNDDCGAAIVREKRGAF